MSDTTTPREAYILGWKACFAGGDGRFTNPFPRRTEAACAWDWGFLDAMEADDSEENFPMPEATGY